MSADRPRDWFAISDIEGEHLFELFCCPPRTLAAVRQLYPQCLVRPLPKQGAVTTAPCARDDFEW